ncbi:MAG: hypothetical protein J6T39_00975, partial [Clostridia bacterium]|nr:hypothetical protein [Clostridia bacterium]
TPEFMIEGSMTERVYNAAKAVLIDVIDDTMTDYEKALALHDYLVETITYDDWGLDNVDSNTKLGYFHYIESALLGSKLAVCDGYSKTYALLCGMEGIECIVVHGTYNRGGHAWNKIFLDLNEDGQKECYAVDTTFDDLHVKQGTKTTEFLTHQFFMIPDSYFDKRTEDSNVSYPSAVSPEKFYSYYKPYGFSLKINSTQTLNDFVDFMEENTEHINLELLVLNSFVDTSNNQVGRINIDLKITYSPNSSYYMVYIHT